MSHHQKRWEAWVSINNKNHYLGVFDNEIKAAQAYNNFAQKIRGEFAKLNEIKE